MGVKDTLEEYNQSDDLPWFTGEVNLSILWAQEETRNHNQVTFIKKNFIIIPLHYTSIFYYWTHSLIL